jgi:hypothetical protein
VRTSPADAVALLLAIGIGPQARLRGKHVKRLDCRPWSIDNGPALLLRPAIDALMGEPIDESPRFPLDSYHDPRRFGRRLRARFTRQAPLNPTFQPTYPFPSRAHARRAASTWTKIRSEAQHGARTCLVTLPCAVELNDRA